MMSSSSDFLLWLGFSQTAKSTCVRLLTGNQEIKVGATYGWKSVTDKILPYKEASPMLGKAFLHLDTIGFGDTRLINKDSLIREKIEEAILKEASVQGVGKLRAILITESYFSDTIRLEILINHIRNMFGFVPSDSIVILLTKKNLVPEEIAKQKKNEVIRIAEMNSISAGKVIDFATPWNGVSTQSIKASTQILAKTVRVCPGFDSSTIVAKYNKIKTRAAELRRLLTKIEKKTVQYETDEVKITPITKYHEVRYQKRRGGVSGLLGQTKTVVERIPYIHNDVSTIKVQATKQIDVEVIPEFDVVFAKAKEEFENLALKIEL